MRLSQVLQQVGLVATGRGSLIGSRATKKNLCLTDAASRAGRCAGSIVLGAQATPKGDFTTDSKSSTSARMAGHANLCSQLIFWKFEVDGAAEMRMGANLN